CSGFTGDLTIPNSVNSIGLSAFSECSGFTGELTIGNSVTSIGSKTFYNCSGFTGGLTIPNSITSIGVAAFGLCSGFTGELIIGNSVTTIGISAFESCDNFNKISCYATNPPSCYPGTTFSVDTESCVLVVPAGTLDDYKMASVWSTFINIVEDSTLAVEDNLVNDIMVYAVGSELMVSGAVDGAVVKVYSLNGAVVANGVVLDGAAQVELPATSGVYIVSVGNQSYKVVR
ncbi:MAG: leucine-rich repeat domain-containing protein, partial [Bacteroidales bacterium]